MTTFLFKNNAISTLAGPISAIATTMTVASGAGALFPSPTGGQVFTLTLVSASNPTLFEIVYCTAVSSDTLTIVRAREGTVGLSFSAGDIVDHRLTAAALTSLVQSGSGFYLATDTGTANALAATVAGVSSLVSGQVYVIKKSALPNTGATTLYVNGLGVTALVWADGTALVDGDWPASVTGLVEYDGVQFNLLSVMGPSVFTRSSVGKTTVALSTPGAGNFTAPITGWYWVENYGAGGGAGLYGSGSTAEGEGGGGGGFSGKWIYLTAGTVVPYVIGAQGASSGAGTGTAGGTTSFGAYHSATGGGPGNVAGTIGAGGTGVGGAINLTGQAGFNGDRNFNALQSGGGDAAGPYGGKGAVGGNATWPGGGGLAAASTTGTPSALPAADGGIIIRY